MVDWIFGEQTLVVVSAVIVALLSALVPGLVGRIFRKTPVVTIDVVEDKYWTVVYPWEAVVPLSVLVESVYILDFSGAQLSALFWMSDDDQMVRPDRMHKVVKAWRGPATVRPATVRPGAMGPGTILHRT